MSDKTLVGYVLIGSVQIDNANAISSPLTYGFPALTGFTGAFHALSRKIMADARWSGLSLGGVLLACYDCSPKIYRPNSYRDYTFIQTRNPIKKDGSTASIVEEGKCNLTMSFVVEVLADDEPSDETKQALMNHLSTAMYQQRIAGGSIIRLATNEPVRWIERYDIDEVWMALMPAFVLMDASDDFGTLIDKARQDNPDVTALDVLLDVSTLHHEPDVDMDGNVHWHHRSIKAGYGWLVPMPMGYQAIGEWFDAGVMAHVRNPEYPSQYVEVVYGLGKWVYPHHLKDDIRAAFWRQRYDERGLYLVTQES